MKTPPTDHYLGWFLGPKAENADFFEKMIQTVIRDYAHWRRNYYPSDPMSISRQFHRDHAGLHDGLHQNLLEMMALLRRNFPFYSPRYLGHQLSDTMMTSVIGYVAGMLYNPNNVTTEAAPVTVDMEIEACNLILEMLGYTPPPDVPLELTRENVLKWYKDLTKTGKDFGWAHLTHGGTTANLEALWIARTVKYFPLAIQDVCKTDKIQMNVRLPGPGGTKPIVSVTQQDLLKLNPNESLSVFPDFVNAYAKEKGAGRGFGEVLEEIKSRLSASEFSLDKGYARNAKDHACAIYVSGAAHYSIKKIADILGIGRAHVSVVDIDKSFRISVADLKNKIYGDLKKGILPLAVVGIVGTTEEGAIDPIHEIFDLRQTLEHEKSCSFWLHIDAAWGGYLRSLFCPSPTESLAKVLNKVSLKVLEREYRRTDGSGENFYESFRLAVKEQQPANADAVDTEAIDTDAKLFALLDSQANYKELLKQLQSKLRLKPYKHLKLAEADLRPDNVDPLDHVGAYVSERVWLKDENYSHDIEIRWAEKSVYDAILAMHGGDSITIDPHKMGYLNYPNGMIAFKNDLARIYVQQSAPYITAAEQKSFAHVPVKHVVADDGKAESYQINVNAFGPFIVEGSRPGAAATSLWLTLKTVPPTRDQHGAIVRASLLAARELYEWLIHWKEALSRNERDADFDLLPLCPPDSNIVIFIVKKTTSQDLKAMNTLTDTVYRKFTIRAELGERQYSYSQPFFLSNTEFDNKNYPFTALRPTLGKLYKSERLKKLELDYSDQGIRVLRATVMSPYIFTSRGSGINTMLRDFMHELDAAAREAILEMSEQEISKSKRR